MTTAPAGTLSAPAALPKISLVTPSFNQADYLETTLRSVLDQGYPNLEYIVVDGSSTDSSVEILERYGPRLAWWTSERDRGHGHALNKGFARASGEILGWINSDDLLLPGSLLLVGSLFAQFAEMDWLTSPGAAAEPLGRLIDAHQPTPWTRSYFLRARDCFIQQESTFWRRDLWERAGGYVSEHLLSCDHELWARFFRYARLYQTPGLIGAFRYRPDQRSVHQRKRYLREVSETLIRERNRPMCDGLSPEDAELLSRVSYDPRGPEFVCRHFPVGDPGGQGDWRLEFLTIDDRLWAVIETPSLSLPPVGIERNPAILRYFPRSLDAEQQRTPFVWLGSGASNGLGVSLTCEFAQAASLHLLASPGPSSGDGGATLQLRHRANGIERLALDVALTAEMLCNCRLDLAAGSNELLLFVPDAPTIADLGNFDPRDLMAMVCEIRIGPDHETGAL